MARDYQRRPDFRGARQKLEQTLREQLYRDMWAGRSIEVGGERVALMNMHMWEIDEYARLLAHHHAKTGTAKFEVTEARIQKLARGEAA